MANPVDFGDVFLAVLDHIHDGMTVLLGWIVYLLYKMDKRLSLLETMVNLMREHYKDTTVLAKLWGKLEDDRKRNRFEDM
jgi:hypothetical protein